MLQVKRLGYVAMDVADLESSIKFYQDVVHLNVSGRRDGLAFLTGGREHHWLILRQNDQSRFAKVAFEMNNETELEAMAERLERAGIKVTSGGDLAKERVERYIRFADPDGLMVELFTGMVELPGEPALRSQRAPREGAPRGISRDRHRQLLPFLFRSARL